VATGKGREPRATPDEFVENEIDRLFQLPLAEFTRARNALTAKLKKDGASEKAAQVKGLTKPSISAWVANQLYWRDRKAFGRLLAAGDQFRTAQGAQFGGKSADIRALTVARREALTELAQHASTLLHDAGYGRSRETMRRITMTLEALATYGESPGAPKPGRLTVDVDPPGFEVLAGLLPRTDHRPTRGSISTRVIPFSQPKPAPKDRETKKDARREVVQRRAREAELRRALHDAERALKDAKREASKVSEKMKSVDGRAKQMEKRRAALEAQFEKAKADAETARREARRLGSRAKEAAQAVDAAERAMHRAREALKDL